MNTSPKAEGKHMSMDFENTGTVSRLTMQRQRVVQPRNCDNYDDTCKSSMVQWALTLNFLINR